MIVAGENLVIGRVVHFVMESMQTGEPGKHRPAIVVQVWDDMPDGKCNMDVFTDVRNDGVDVPVLWKTSVPYSKEPKPGTWHWPERTPHV